MSPTGTCAPTGPRFWAPDRDGRPGRARHAARGAGHGGRLLAPAAPFASDWLHRALDGNFGAPCRFPVVAGHAGRRRWRGRWTRCGGWPRWAARRARSGGSGCGSRSPDAGGGAGGGPRRGVRRAARAARGAKSTSRRSRSWAPTPISSGSSAQAQLPLARQALRQAHARDRRRGRGLTAEQLRGLEQAARATLEVDGETASVRPGGRRRGARSGERLDRGRATAPSSWRSIPC